MPDDVIRCPRCNYDSNPTFWDEHGCPTCAVLQAAKDRERRELAKAVAKVLALQRPSASRREQRSHVRAVLAELKKSGAIAPSNGGDRRMGIEDAAVYLAISESSLYKLAERLALPHEKHGNRLIFRQSDLDAYGETRRRSPEQVRKLAEQARERPSHRRPAAVEKGTGGAEEL